jgi:hypothetical protein
VRRCAPRIVIREDEDPLPVVTLAAWLLLEFERVPALAQDGSTEESQYVIVAWLPKP